MAGWSGFRLCRISSVEFEGDTFEDEEKDIFSEMRGERRPFEFFLRPRRNIVSLRDLGSVEGGAEIIVETAILSALDRNEWD